MSQTHSPADPVTGSLVLAAPNGLGRALGLRPGDRVISVNGLPVDPRPEALGERLRHPGRPAALCLERSGQRWLVLTDTAALGRWRRDARPADPPGTAARRIHPETLRNWEILRAADGRYDVHPVALPLLALIAPPLWLSQTRLWGALSIWAALVLVGLPAGWPAMLALHAIAALYFWKSGPALWRADRLALGLRPEGVIAAAREADVHAAVQARFADARYLHLASRPADHPIADSA